ncbi:MAG: Smr/MutS family protein [Bacteroidota bacterium]
MIRKGTKVRLLNEAIEGVVLAVFSPERVELEDHHGFRRIVSVTEIVEIFSDPVQEVEKRDADKMHVKSESGIASKDAEIRLADEESVLVELKRNLDSIAVELINASKWQVVYEGGRFSAEIQYSLFNGQSNPLSRVHLTDFTLQSIGSLEGLYFQAVFFDSKPFESRPPQYKQIRLNQKELQVIFSGEQHLRKQIFSLGSDTAIIGRLLDKFSDREAAPPGSGFTTKTANSGSRSSFIIPKEKVVDLHIEKLIKDPASMSSGQIIALQLSVFEKEMDNAFLTGITSLIFIHGIGSGILRSSIREELKKYDQIRYGDAPAEKFGRGATQIHFK